MSERERLIEEVRSKIEGKGAVLYSHARKLCDALEEAERRVGELEGALEKCAGWLGGEYMVYRVHAKHVNTEALGRLLEEIYGVLDAGVPEPRPEAGPGAGEGRGT